MGPNQTLSTCAAEQSLTAGSPENGTNPKGIGEIPISETPCIFSGEPFFCNLGEVHQVGVKVDDSNKHKWGGDNIYDKNH